MNIRSNSLWDETGRVQSQRNLDPSPGFASDMVGEFRSMASSFSAGCSSPVSHKQLDPCPGAIAGGKEEPQMVIL